MKSLYGGNFAGVGLLALMGCSSAMRPASWPIDGKQAGKISDECQPLVYKKVREGEIVLAWWMRVPHTSARTYQYPAFNPRQPNQVAFLLDISAAEAKPKRAMAGLWVADLSTQRCERVLADRAIQQFRVRPGSNDWLTYNTEGQTWCLGLRDGGRRQLTHGFRHRFPQWSPDGRRLVASVYPSDNLLSGLVLLDSAGQRIPTPALEALNGVPGPWSPDGEWLLWSGAQTAGTVIRLYNFATGESRSVGSVPGGANPWYWYFPWVMAAWLPDSRGFVWCNSAGLFRTTLATGSTVQVRSGCERRIYESVAVARDGQHLLVQRADQRIERDSINVYRETNLWTMNLDGSNERKLVFKHGSRKYEQPTAN